MSKVPLYDTAPAEHPPLNKTQRLPNIATWGSPECAAVPRRAGIQVEIVYHSSLGLRRIKKKMIARADTRTPRNHAKTLFGLPQTGSSGQVVDLISVSNHDKYSGSTKITTHPDHISQCKASPGTNWSNKWTNRAFIMNIRRDWTVRRTYAFLSQSPAGFLQNQHGGFSELLVEFFQNRT
jgi:hypothetical protein